MQIWYSIVKTNCSIITRCRKDSWSTQACPGRCFVLLEVSNKISINLLCLWDFLWKFPLIYISILLVSTITGSLVTLIVCKNPQKSFVMSSYLTRTCLDRCSVLQICYPNFVLYYAWYIIYYIYIYIYLISNHGRSRSAGTP